MNKLEKGKLKEVSDDLYYINLYIGLNWLNNKGVIPVSELNEYRDKLARCVRQLRDLSM